MFISCLRKVILLNKRRRAKLDHLIEIILNAKQNKEKLQSLQLNKKNHHAISTKLFKFFLNNDIDIIAPIEHCMQETLAYVGNVDACFSAVTNKLKVDVLDTN